MSTWPIVRISCNGYGCEAYLDADDLIDTIAETRVDQAELFVKARALGWTVREDVEADDDGVLSGHCPNHKS